ncbi:MAG: HDIG domain-containing protein [Methanobacteriota archaeon]|nr:MAG: HDIG domain-containing protein [Euryarchaeota archaeon]
MLSRDEAWRLVEEKIESANLRKHVLAVEAIMRGLARHLGEDEELWGLTGLLHDIDYGETESRPQMHTVLAGEMLDGKAPAEVIRAIKCHNSEHTGIEPETAMEKALISADSLSGLLIACALVQPTKKMADVNPRSVKKKFKQKDFARAVSRERIRMCEEIGIELPQLYEIGLESLKGISEELGL